MPYPLPDEGPPYTADLRWFLVAVPDDVAFVRAAMGAYTEFTKYWVWGKEGKEAGRNEAAQAWEAAVAATLEALEMGFPDILLGHIDEVEDLLRQLSALGGCCGELSHPFADLLTDPWQEGDPVPENIVDAGFASSTADQAGYTDYKCLIANVAVQDLIEKINRLAQLIDESNWIVGGVAAVASILTFVVALPAAATVLTAMALGLVAGAGTAAGVWAWLNGVGKATAESTALALDAVYDDLVCAIYQADGPDAATTAVAAVIADATNAAASLALTPVISMVIHALYAGRYDQTDTAAALANAGFTLAQHDCQCSGPQPLLEWNFDDSIEGWTQGQWDSGNGYPEPGAFYTAGPGNYNVPENEHNLPLSGTVTIKCYAKNYSSIANGTITVAAYLDVGAGNLLVEQTPQNLGAGWAEYQFGPAAFELSRLDRWLFIRFTCGGVSSQFAYIDNVRIYVEPS